MLNNFESFLENELLNFKIDKSLSFSNKLDCKRYGCLETPWNWASHWVLERIKFEEGGIVVDLGAGINPIIIEAFSNSKKGYLALDLLNIPSANLSENIFGLKSDISKLPIKRSSVETVLSISVLEHLSEPDRLKTIKEIERILVPEGRAIITIGNFMQVSKKATYLLKSLEFFKKRGSAGYPPINIKTILDVTKKLELIESNGLEFFPGYERYNEKKIINHPLIIKDKFSDFKEISQFVSLRDVMVCEIGLELVKKD
jgi:SAM-dependent methyltransferase